MHSEYNNNQPLHHAMNQHCRILFLRSPGNVIASAVVAQGLQASQSFEFSQYPSWPDEFQSRLKKLEQGEDIWNALHTGIIPTSRELSMRLSRREFDLILLADYNGALFRYAHSALHQKLRLLLNVFRQKTGRSWAKVIQYYRYVCSFPFSLRELTQFAPIIVVEMADLAYLTLENLELLRECTAYFKREVPYNRFALFTVRHFSQEAREFIRQEVAASSSQKPVIGSWKDHQGKLLHLVEKVSNIPLGIADKKYAELKTQRVLRQDIDVLFVGAMTNTMRMRGQQLVQELAANSSWNIVLEESLPFEDYCRMVARSKITISIAGGGWDCFRHYEAVALGSLPLINKPTIDAVWWHPMPEAIFFENTFVNFRSRIEQLLTNDSLRKTCFEILEQQVEHHTLHSKIVEYIINTSLEKLSCHTSSLSTTM